MDIEVLGEIESATTIARGRQIRELDRLKRVYGPGRWIKRKGVARVRLPDGSISLAEMHWYEAHGVGKRELKVKRLLRGNP